MRSLKQIALVAVVALAAACGVKADGPPEIQVDRTACAHCTMLVSEPRYAAAYRTADGEAQVFDDIGCLLDALGKEPKAPARYWFKDANDGAWIDGDAASFVLSDAIRTPMSGGITAYRDLQSAESAASRHAGSVVETFAELRRMKGRS